MLDEEMISFTKKTDERQMKSTSRYPGSAAEAAEQRKHIHYEFMKDRYIFIPVALESTRSLGKGGTSIDSDHRSNDCWKNWRETSNNIPAAADVHCPSTRKCRICPRNSPSWEGIGRTVLSIISIA